MQSLSYGSKNLDIAINFSYELLEYKTRKVFLSLCVFEGKDFSIEAVSYINELSATETKKYLNILTDVSLVEQSTKTHYRIHPLIKKFLRDKFDNPSLFLRAAKYYEQFLSQYDKDFLKSYPNIKQISDNVLYVFKRCYELQYWDEVIALWNPLESLLYATNQLNKTRYLYQIVTTQKTGINTFQKVLAVCFCILLVYWLVLYLGSFKTSIWNDLYSFSFGLIPLIGGGVGLLIAQSWGLFKSTIGKAILFLSAGLFSWGIGSLIWSYYNFFIGILAPYPSLADIGYIPSYFLWTIRIINLPHAIGGKINFRRKYREMLLMLIPVFVLTLSYCLFVIITKNNVVFAPLQDSTKFFFDIAYPAADTIILTTALVLGTSFRFFGGKYKLSIYSILIGFVFMYIGDFMFSYMTTTGKYYNGGITDLFFTIGMFFLTFGIFGFYLQKPNNHS